MPPFKALYYPSWNPPVKWLRSMLLFFDQIYVIRPEDIKDPGYYPANQAVCALIPHVFGEIRRKRYEMSLDIRNRDLFITALNDIADKFRRSRRKPTIVIDKNGNKSVEGHVFLHASKLPAVIYDELEPRSLVNTELEPLFYDDFGIGNFHIIQEDASNLILSLIADHYARRERFRIITDQPTGYIVNSFNTDPKIRNDSASMLLASSIIRVEIPDNITKLTPKKYIELRDRHEGIRKMFHHVVRTLCDDYQLSQIENVKEYEDVVHEATRDFFLEIEALRRTDWGSTIKRWTPVCVGVLSSICGLGSDTAIEIGVGLEVLLKFYDGIKPHNYMSDYRQTQHMLANLRSELLRESLLKKYLLRSYKDAF